MSTEKRWYIVQGKSGKYVAGRSRKLSDSEVQQFRTWGYSVVEDVQRNRDTDDVDLVESVQKDHEQDTQEASVQWGRIGIDHELHESRRLQRDKRRTKIGYDDILDVMLAIGKTREVGRK